MQYPIGLKIDYHRIDCEDHLKKEDNAMPIIPAELPPQVPAKSRIWTIAALMGCAAIIAAPAWAIPIVTPPD